MRKLKFHEKKLLKKTNLFAWKSNQNIREGQMVHRYQLTDREDYIAYNKLVGLITKLVGMLRKLPASDSDRIKMTEILLEKLHAIGVISSTQSLELCSDLSTSSFCRRRLSSILVEQKFVERMNEAVKFIQQGHVAVGPTVITDAATLVTREMEDHIKWSEGSKIKRQLLRFGEGADDFEMNGA
jgi:U3 small nucleolar ribonucleoprotein protein IMP3